MIYLNYYSLFLSTTNWVLSNRPPAWLPLTLMVKLTLTLLLRWEINVWTPKIDTSPNSSTQYLESRFLFFFFFHFISDHLLSLNPDWRSNSVFQGIWIHGVFPPGDWVGHNDHGPRYGWGRWCYRRDSDWFGEPVLQPPSGLLRSPSLLRHVSTTLRASVTTATSHHHQQHICTKEDIGSLFRLYYDWKQNQNNCNSVHFCLRMFQIKPDKNQSKIIKNLLVLRLQINKTKTKLNIILILQ